MAAVTATQEPVGSPYELVTLHVQIYRWQKDMIRAGAFESNHALAEEVRTLLNQTLPEHYNKPIPKNSTSAGEGDDPARLGRTQGSVQRSSDL